MPRKKRIEGIPEKFGSYEEAAEFWDKHDTTDYPSAFRTVEVTAKLRRRVFEIEIEAEVAAQLRLQAKRRGTTPTHLANELLRRQLVPTQR